MHALADDEIYDRGLRYEDLVRASDVVMTKPGYGIVSECVANGAAIVYTSRGQFAEYPVMVAEMPSFLRCTEITSDDLLAGRWLMPLERVVRLPQPVGPIATNGAEVIADMIGAALRRRVRLIAQAGGPRREADSRTVLILETRSMISRRRFLGSSAAAMVVSRMSGAAASDGQRGSRDSASAVPFLGTRWPDVDARSARPITNDERRARIERARQLMAQSKIDAIMLAGGTSLRLLHRHPLGQQRAAVRRHHPGQRRAVLRLPGLRGGPRAASSSRWARWRRHGRRPDLAGGREPVRARRQGLKDRGIATGRLGVEETAKFVFADSVAGAAPR